MRLAKLSYPNIPRNSAFQTSLGVKILDHSEKEVWQRNENIILVFQIKVVLVQLNIRLFITSRLK